MYFEKNQILSYIKWNNYVVCDANNDVELCANTSNFFFSFADVKAVEEFPLIFKSSFKIGFPDNWREVIKETVRLLLLEQDLEWEILFFQKNSVKQLVSVYLLIGKCYMLSFYM